ncbi:MAG TPA: MFS transporter [Acidimicrobiales bacterium]|jgi:EmrB/QacA subfamily drug resistance transporter|nr:MFS transporter [Acidimicrobiales bacterium]
MTTTPDRMAIPPDSPAVPVDPHYERRWLILLVVLIAQVMILIDATVINVALPSAQKSLHFSTANREWVITAYVLAFGSLLPLGGRLADLLGRKKMFLLGLVGFGLFSAVAGAAPDTAVLLIARTLQGVFAAVLAPTAVSMIAVTFTDPGERNKAFAIFGAGSGSAGALGLLLGGVLTSYVNWRWTMFVNVAFAAAAIVGALALMTNSADPRRPRLDVPGTILVSGGLFLLVFGGAKAETDGWGASITIASFVVGLVLLAGFILVERRASYALVPLRVLTNRNRGASYLALGLSNASLFAVFLFLTYYFQEILGYSPVKTGLLFLPVPLSIGVAATITQAKLLPLLSTRSILAGGMTLSAIGVGLLTQVGVQGDYVAWVLPSLVLMGAGFGPAFVVAIAMGSVPDHPEDAGTAGSMNNVSQQIGAALGIALISTIVASATTSYLHAHAPTNSSTLAHASVHGYRAGSWWAAAIFLAGAVICSAVVKPKIYLSDAATTEAVEETIPAIG